MSASIDNTIKIWDRAAGQAIKEIIIDENEDRRMQYSPISFFLTPDGRFIGGGLEAPTSKDGGLLKIWRISDGKLIQALPIKQNFHGYYEELNKITISDDGNFIVLASCERMVKVWTRFLPYLHQIDVASSALLYI